MKDSRKYLGNEKGMVLVVSLLLLITLTVLGLAAISTTSTEIKISGNERVNAQAFNAAEAGLREVLYRLGTPVGKDIVDPGLSPAGCVDSPCANPAWNARIFFANADPANPDANTIYAQSILPAADASGRDLWTLMNYATTDTNDPDNALSIRYATEADYPDSLVFNNSDGDQADIVYYDKINHQRKAALGSGGGVQVDGTVDYNPPAGLIKDDAIMIINIKGSNGNARKTVTVEITRKTVNPQVGAAVTAGIQLKMNGNTFISGFNHLPTVTSGDTGSDATKYNANGCDNFGKKGQATRQGCGLGVDPDTANAAYSAYLDTGGNKPGLLYDPADGLPTFTGNAAEVWGGDDTTQWAEPDASGFPELSTMLNIDQTELDEILEGADVTTANADTDCPVGITYIEGGQTYTPPTGCNGGSGILYVKGDAEFSGSFEFRGLIYVEGDFNLKGTPWILGAVAVKGNTNGEGLKFQSGTPRILYSKKGVEEAVSDAIFNPNADKTNFLSWKEG